MPFLSDAATTSYMEAINTARGAEGLELEAFTKSSDLEADTKKLYGLTCEMIDSATIDPAVSFSSICTQPSAEG